MNRCFYCHSLLLLSYYYDIYDNKCCKKHIDSENSVSYCSECMKLVPTKGNTVGDGRVICGECMKIAVTPKRPYDWILKQVVARLYEMGFTDIDAKDVVIWTATSKEIAMYKKGNLDVFNEGFCSLQADGKIKIYVQSHHTKIHYAGILAHELLHAWCFKHNLLDIPSQIAEGMSNLGSYCVYHTIDYPLARIYETRLFEDPDPIYGDGFRMMFDAYEKLGWDGVRNLVVQSNK